ncbi:hypothetical protein NNX28_10155 [Arthrobacter sp. zg-Y859]|uniref:Uncharacterized protein n=1 Tax=Arthrobacter jinronghuae TaxID=2964609 RepID=A0ABT1NT93_9MICC|nr:MULTISPECIES: hypothetical protein [Arthrobacter]MCQ1950292.1 hypothetical protein [Arthrobacter jinronghuae]MCQ1953309.1 hypothetical protein [Arthrobacter sp. zg-Y238]UWX77272.1 hypothetical protein N2K98_09645 [Arthrobacter jinronghuae]
MDRRTPTNLAQRADALQLIEIPVYRHAANPELLSKVIDAYKSTLIYDLADEAEAGSLTARFGVMSVMGLGIVV